jgi:hypothetical protein
MASPGRLLEHVGEKKHQQHHEDRAIGEDGAAKRNLVAEKLQQRRLVGDVLSANGLVGGIKEIGGQHDLPHAERDDEGRKLHHGDKKAVDKAAECAARDAGGHGQFRRKAVTE